MSDDLAKQLFCWAMEEMHFRPLGRHIQASLPSEADFSHICIGQMENVWKYVKSRVFTPQTIKQVRGNLQLRQVQRSKQVLCKTPGKKHHTAERQHMEQEKLKMKIVKTRGIVSHLEDTIKQYQTDVQDFEQQCKITKQNVEKMRRSSALLRCYSSQCQEALVMYQDYNSRLKQCQEMLTHFQTHSSSPIYFPQEKDKGSSLLENGCSKSVRESCLSIEKFLQRSLSRQFVSDKRQAHIEKRHLWHSVEETLKDYPASQIMAALLQHLQACSLDLQKLIANTDVQKDAELLRFRCESDGQFVDITNPMGDLQSVQQILEDICNLHVQSFIHCENSYSLTFKSRQKVQELQSVLHSKLEKHFSKDKQTLFMAKALLDAELEFAKCQAAMSALQECAELLHKKASSLTQRQMELKKMGMKIQDFQKIAENQQNVIRTLTKQNMESVPRLNHQQHEVREFVEHMVNSENNTLARQNCDDLHDAVTQTVYLYRPLALEHLCQTEIESNRWLSTNSLSVHRLQELHRHPGSSEVKQLFQFLDLIPQKSAENFLHETIRMKNAVQQLECAKEFQGFGGKQGSASGDQDHYTSEYIQELCSQVRDHDSEQTKTMLPLLLKEMSILDMAHKSLARTRDSVCDWWEQPAQNTVCSVTARGLSLQQWREKLTVVVNKQRQLKSAHFLKHGDNKCEQ